MFVKNTDGSYKILTGISEGKSAVEVRNAGTSAGENIQQYEVNGASCQNWIPEPVSDPGISMDTDLIYTFENLNSGLVMDIENGLMENNSNVQQYISNKMNCQKWTLKSFGSGNYYWIRSLQNENYALKAEGNGNGSNIDIAEYSSKDSSQLFRFTKNLNGSYSIITHASKDNCLVETSYASEEKGANIQQWERTDNDCQKWELHTEKRIVTISGDVNNDGIFNITDALILQRWLLGMPDTTLEILENGDLYDDGILNVFDLCIMKKMLIQ